MQSRHFFQRAAPAAGGRRSSKDKTVAYVAEPSQLLNLVFKFSTQKHTIHGISRDVTEGTNIYILERTTRALPLRDVGETLGRMAEPMRGRPRLTKTLNLKN